MRDPTRGKSDDEDWIIQQFGYNTVRRTVHKLRQCERAADAQRLTQRQTLGLRAGMWP